MKSFIQYLNEEKKINWSKIDSHYKNLPNNLKSHIDKWIGISPNDVKSGAEGGIMDSKSLEKNWKAVHKANHKIRQELKQTHGKTLTVFRGIGKNGKQKSRILDSYTTNRKVAEHFAGGGSKSLKPYSERDIKHHENKLNKSGRTKIGNKHLVHVKDNGEKYISLQDDTGNEITDVPSVRDHIKTSNEFIHRHNKRIKDARSRVEVKQIPINRIVHATNHMNQQEIIVKRNMK